ncbi:MAG: hypothetical protein A3C07_03845 [Candidatus Sungbacteria bacterium RIFCSPHIGHO2_02_FULL_47_11]|uniref:VWFA domain-containing protein n=1 Tax=Candidatus Sungbacteria bacterium RIFCSPHIGHO2_02_FULL_47_11 TaxID=1802270 RepID=A0A1G2KI84_9BACT|nr:MAG: hypothetical protein A3C07_03845 [Candidatus Sungbacteria bacterium RIFCSPHIGHO2_02_FULL_47_11]
MTDFWAVFDVVFRRPELLWFCVLFVVGIPAFFFWKRKVVLQTLEDPWIRMHLPNAKLPSSLRYFFIAIGFGLLCSLLVAVIAEPERRLIHKEPVYGHIRVAFVLDTSLSMVRAEDVLPNRLAGAKEVIKRFVDKLWYAEDTKGHYSISLVPFAGGAVSLYLPFTTSRESFLESLENVDGQTITTAGTSLLAALNGYGELLRKYPARDKETVDIAILISDGGKEEGIGVERNEIGQEIKSLQGTVRIYTIGVGTVQVVGGKRIPQPVKLVIRGDDGSFDYMRRVQGNANSPPLVSSLDEDILQVVARMGGGEYAFFENKENLFGVFQDIILKNRKLIDYADRTLYVSAVKEFLIPAIILAFFLFGYVRSAAIFLRIRL